MNIVFLDADTIGNNSQIESLKQFGTLTIFNRTTKDQTIERIKNADIVITNKVVLGKTEIDSATKLKLICITATGMNNIDLGYAAEKGITVKNAIGYSTPSVTQFVFSSLLNVMSKVQEYDNYVKSGSYSNQELFTNLSFPIDELSGKTFGIVGMGNIGRSIANVAAAFGANVIYYSTSGQNHGQAQKNVSFDELLTQSDIISINCPLNDKTANLFSADALSKLKPSAILINAGRGGIVDENALAKVLNENKIQAAICDVFVQEPLQADSPLLNVPSNKIVMAPHIAWASVQARERLMEMVIENIKQFLSK